MKRLLAFTGFLLSLLVVMGLPEEIKSVIEEKEALVVQLAQEAASLFRRRGRLQSQCECSIHVCRTGFSQHACNLVQRQLAAICGGAHCLRQSNGAATFVETPPGLDRDAVSNEMKENICLYKFMEPILMQLNPEATTTTRISTKDGHSRVFPGASLKSVLSKQEELIGDACAESDPRRQSHYVGASVGPKDIVFVVDSSLEMSKPWSRVSNISRLESVNDAIQSVLDSLSSIDRVNLVAFSDKARRRGTGRGLFRGSANHVYALKRSINALHPLGRSNIRAGIKLAFKLLTESSQKRKRRDRFHRGQKVIVVVTGSTDHADRTGRPPIASRFLRRVARRQERLKRVSGSRATIFTYAIGDDVESALLKQIACANDGASFSVGPDDDAFSVLNRFNTFLTSTHGATYPIWTDFKWDPYTKGPVATVAKAFHLMPGDGQNALLLGVVSHEVRLKDLKSGNWTQREIERELIDRSRTHDTLDALPCQLQVYRNVYAKGSICVDTMPVPGRPREWTGTSGRNRNKCTGRDPPCFEREGRFYKTSLKKVIGGKANKNCQDEGGNLVHIKSYDELAFLASMASEDGTWVAPQKLELLQELYWVQDGSPLEQIQIRRGINLSDACIRIDNSGSTGNLEAVSCNQKLSYLCVHKTEKHCSCVIPLPKKGFFTNPPLDLCIQEEESLANAAALSAATMLPSSHLWCSLDHGTRDLQSMCCEGCPEDIFEEVQASIEAEDLDAESFIDDI